VTGACPDAAAGAVGQVRSGALGGHVCPARTQPDPDGWCSCPDCGQPGRRHVGRCARCTLDKRLRNLLGDEHSEIRAELLSLYQSLALARCPGTVSSWLDSSATPAILRDIKTRTRPLTHQTLDELPAGKPVEHLRSVLVATGALPPRDEQMVRLERWITITIAGRDDRDERELLHRYAVWHLLRRLRCRAGGAETTYSQLVAVRRHAKAAITLLDWLARRDLTLASARQGDLDAWLISGEAVGCREAGHFVRWARRHKLTSLDFPATRWRGPACVIDTEARWEQARRLLNDDALKPGDRVAGLLVLLYAQWPSVISRLTLDHVQATGSTVQLHLGREPLILPEPLASLVCQIAATRRGHAALGDQETSPWLFPGGQPGRPISAYQLAGRLRQLGIRSGQSRSTALFQLATDLPAAILARLLGIHINVAVTWQRASAGDWTDYAAEVSRRTQPHDRHSDSSDS
jgi:hypothetical protein